MTVRCVSCSSFSLQRVKPELAARGFGHCEHLERFITHKAVIDRECGLYQPEQDASVVQKRNDWLEGRG